VGAADDAGRWWGDGEPTGEPHVGCTHAHTLYAHAHARTRTHGKMCVQLSRLDLDVLRCGQSLGCMRHIFDTMRGRRAVLGTILKVITRAHLSMARRAACRMRLMLMFEVCSPTVCIV
jgi:hypothetical protein